jgi:aryl-alcohol dehydrogenase-like predicted oxidoreductase
MTHSAVHDAPLISLATTRWGVSYAATPAGRPDPLTVRDMLALARDCGIADLETDPAYPDSEAAVGGLTDAEPEWRITTRLSPDVFRPGHNAAHALEATDRSLAQSRAALRRETLDSVMLQHQLHMTMHRGVVWRRLLTEREAGRVRQLGVSAVTPDEAWQLLSNPEVQLIQVASSLLDQRLYASGFFERARELGRTVQVRDIFQQGAAFLAPASLPRRFAGMADALGEIRRAADARGASMRDTFLAFARSLGPVRVLISCERPSQLLQVASDWECSAIGTAEAVRIAEALPPIDARLLDPVPSKTTRQIAARRTAASERLRAPGAPKPLSR